MYIEMAELTQILQEAYSRGHKAGSEQTVEMLKNCNSLAQAVAAEVSKKNETK